MRLVRGRLDWRVINRAAFLEGGTVRIVHVTFVFVIILMRVWKDAEATEFCLIMFHVI